VSKVDDRAEESAIVWGDRRYDFNPNCLLVP
jgi:hypothetical protein